MAVIERFDMALLESRDLILAAVFSGSLRTGRRDARGRIAADGGDAESLPGTCAHCRRARAPVAVG